MEKLMIEKPKVKKKPSKKSSNSANNGFKKGKKKTGGRKKGIKNVATLEKEKIYEEHQQAILRELGTLRDAHFDIAKGTRIMLAKAIVMNEKTKKKERKGKFYRVKNPEEMEVILNTEEDDAYHVIYTQDPNPKALEDIINRVFGRPKEQYDVNFKLNELKTMQDDIRELVDLEKKKKS